MVSAVKFSMAIILVIGLTCWAYAIKCFECDSVFTPKCGIQIEQDDTLLLDCFSAMPKSFLDFRNATGCKKTTYEYPVGQIHVSRRCFFGNISNIQSACQPDSSLPFLKHLSCDVCAEDMCNGSSS